METSDLTTYSLSGIGFLVSLTDFKNWLDILLIVLSIVNILIIIFMKLHKYLKDKKLDEEEKKDLLNDLHHLNEELEKFNKKEGTD